MKYNYEMLIKQDPASDTGTLGDEILFTLSNDDIFTFAHFEKKGTFVVTLAGEYFIPGARIDIWVARDGEIRGLAIDKDVKMYETASEYGKKARELAMESLAQIEEFSKSDPSYEEEFDARMNSLIDAFQERIKGIESRNPRTHWTTMPYEFFICEEAQKVLKWRTTLARFLEWTELSYAEKVSTPGLRRRRHSEETIKAVEMLVFAHLLDGSAKREHAAACELFGCELAGCWSSGPEALLERQRNAKEANRTTEREQSGRTNASRDSKTRKPKSGYNA